MQTMRRSPDANSPSRQDHAAQSPSHILQTAFLIVLLLAGLLISFLVVRYIDPGASKSGVVSMPEVHAVERGGALSA